MLSSEFRFRLEDQNAISMGNCRFAPGPAGAGSGLGPACPLAERAPGQHRPGSGGRLIDMGSNGKKLAAAFQQIEDDLRTQYAATNTSTNTKLDGSFRKLSVECRGDGMKVHVRKSYFAPRRKTSFPSSIASRNNHRQWIFAL
jgi:hypothetical protein